MFSVLGAAPVHLYGLLLLQDENKRVTVIETSSGKKLTGEEAPLKSDLEKWLTEHPG